MRRLLIAMLCALGFVHSVAFADDRKACTSITQSDCADLPRVTAKGDLRVEILERKRELSWFAPSSADDDLTNVCPGGKCTCSENIQYLEFKGSSPGLAQVNAAERATLNRLHCSAENADVDRQITHFELSAHLVSIAAFELEYCHGCGGSCHGTTSLTTYNADNGQLLRVQEVLKPNAAETLRRHMIDFIVANHGREYGSASLRQMLSEELSRRNLLEQGVYAERGTLYINLDSFVLGCAGGSFYPIPIPRDLVVSSVAMLLD